MNVLICGGAGFIGSEFIRNHLKNNPDSKITNLDVLTVGSNLENLKELKNNLNYKFIKDTIRNESLIDSLVKDADVTINFAAESHVDRSIANPKPFLETNILGTYSILEAIRKYDKQFIHVSTDEIYGDAYGQSSFDENSQINPSNPYAATKAGVIQLSKVVAMEYAAKKIRVNAIAPGQLHTPMVEARLAGQRTGGDVEALLKQRLARIPLGFMGDGNDTANAAVFLASEEARFITGTELIVDGGMTARCD